jgi:uncharacterized Tic20 family protein
MSEVEVTSQAPVRDERTVAALSHVTAILPMWGLIAAIVIWVNQKDKSEYVRFQSLQAIVYQLLIVLGWFLGMGCYMLSAVAMIIVAPATEAQIERFAAEPGALFYLSVALPFLVLSGILLVWLVALAYAIAGAVMTLQGKDFRYLILGSSLRRYLEKT